MSVDERIAEEVQMYVDYCEAAAKHDHYEQWYKMAARMIFYHIQEMRSTGKITVLGLVSGK